VPFPVIDPAARLKMLEPPTGKVAVVFDTDTANEIDDQFALAWALLTPEIIDLKAVIAEPFSFAIFAHPCWRPKGFEPPRRQTHNRARRQKRTPKSMRPGSTASRSRERRCRT